MSDTPYGKQCLSKKRYSSLSFARHVADRCERDRGTRLRVYECRYCYGYHLTKSIRKPMAIE